MSDRESIQAAGWSADVVIRGAHCATGPGEMQCGDLWISGGRIASIGPSENSFVCRAPRHSEVDLSGYLLLPGLINAHDHLEFALYPKLGQPPYQNYIDWGEDIHARFADRIAVNHRVPGEVRLGWGGLRNLVCGVTTVCHHNPLYDALRRPDYPVRVVQEYGWAHSVGLGANLRAARTATPAGRPFIVHACEGTDRRARDEVELLEEWGILDEFAVLVHGLALDREGVVLVRNRGASLILCPSSNFFLFGVVPDLSLLGAVPRMAIGSDSPLTATGDLLDEFRFAVSMCGTPVHEAYRMVTSQAAGILRLGNGEGSLRRGGVADLIAVSAEGCEPAERLAVLSMHEVDLVLIGGAVQLASEKMLERLPAAAVEGLEPLLIGEAVRWVRAPVSQLLEKAEEALGEGQVSLGGRAVHSGVQLEADHAL